MRLLLSNSKLGMKQEGVVKGRDAYIGMSGVGGSTDVICDVSRTDICIHTPLSMLSSFFYYSIFRRLRRLLHSTVIVAYL